MDQTANWQLTLIEWGTETHFQFYCPMLHSVDVSRQLAAIWLVVSIFFGTFFYRQHLVTLDRAVDWLLPDFSFKLKALLIPFYFI